MSERGEAQSEATPIASHGRNEVEGAGTVDVVTTQGVTMNALTVDVEGFIESNRQSVTIPPSSYDEASESRE